MKKAVLLLSGGLDSATVLAMAKQQGYEVFALSFLYGQRHSGEIEAAKKIAKTTGVADHKIANIDLTLFAGSALTSKIPVPKHKNAEEIGREIPVTYVPARNIIFLSFAVAYAESIGASDIFIGVNSLDYSGYPDCRPEFIAAFEKMANIGTAAGTRGEKITLQTPLINMSKAEIIKTGMALGVDYGLTTSCYDPESSRPCGECDACLLRAKGFAENNLPDPLLA
jgi:7-cyano-7-deazaguanine synthase